MVKMVKIILLVVGYILALPPLLLLIPRLNKKFSLWPGGFVLAAEFAGAILISLGWFLRDNIIGSLINGSWVVILAGLVYRAKRKEG